MDPSGDDLERATIVNKKSSKGPFWQSRFFRTRMNHLQYWSNKEAFTKDPWTPSSDFDICDFKVIEYKVGRFLNLMKDEKYGLHLQFSTEVECREWYETLLAKKALYSVQELVVDMRGANKCVTQTFAHMLILGETEQSRWISERIEEQFSVASKANCGASGGNGGGAGGRCSKSDDIVSISAARRCLEDFLHTCQDCATEMLQRNPKIMANCRRYMHMYERLLTGRLILQLSCMVPASQGNKRQAGASQKQKRKLSELGERVLCASIALMERLEAAKSFVFLNQDTYRSVTETVFTMGELLSALLDLSIERIEAWFSAVHSLPLTQRAGRMLELKPVLLETLGESHLEIIAAHDSELQSSLYTRVITSTLLTFHDQLAAIEFGEYSTDALVAHINACQAISDAFSSAKLTWAVPSTRPIFTSTVPVPVPALTQGISSKSAKHVIKTTSPTAVTAALDVEMYEIAIPTAVLDSLRDICFLSARAASVELVCSVGRASSPMLLDNLIVSSDNKGWLGGAACRLFVDHFREWCACTIAQIPERFGRIVSSEVGRLMVRLYMHAVINRYAGDKRLKLDDAGVEQMDNDLASLEAWILANVSSERRGGELKMEELHLLCSMRQFMRAPQDALLDAFAQAVLHFGSAQGLQVYDLLRLALKIRLDMSTKVRKNVLGLATEFLQVLMQTLAADPELMLGAVLSRTARQVRVLDELCPRAGAEHCTGKKWSLETLPDPTVARFIISQVIARVCAAARKQREERQRSEREDKVERAADLTETSLGVSPAAMDASSSLQNESAPAPAALHGERKLLAAVKGLEAGSVETKEGEGDGESDPVLFDELNALHIDEAAESDEEKETAVGKEMHAAAPAVKGLRVFGGGGKAAASSPKAIAEAAVKPSLVPVPIPAEHGLRPVTNGVARSASASRRVPPPPPPPPATAAPVTPAAAAAANPFDDEDDGPPTSAPPSLLVAGPEESSREESLRPLPVAVLVSGSGPVKAPPPKPARPSLAGTASTPALTPSLSAPAAPPRVSGISIVSVDSTPVPRPNPFSVPTEPLPSPYAPPDRSIRGVAGSAAADEANRQAALRRQRSSIQDRLKNA